MAPKKKGGKKQGDDWEAELGEAVPGESSQPAEQELKEEAKNEDDDDMGGGLLAAVRKNRNKKAKKGKALDSDFVDLGDPEQSQYIIADIVHKQPEEAAFNDDDIFGPPKKGKAAAEPAKEQPKEEVDDLDDEPGKVKSKKEKEKEKKEREKQRKKEQVRIVSLTVAGCFGLSYMH
jgi:translation initiation factor 5B